MKTQCLNRRLNTVEVDVKVRWQLLSGHWAMGRRAEKLNHRKIWNWFLRAPGARLSLLGVRRGTWSPHQLSLLRRPASRITSYTALTGVFSLRGNTLNGDGPASNSSFHVIIVNIILPVWHHQYCHQTSLCNVLWGAWPVVICTALVSGQWSRDSVTAWHVSGPRAGRGLGAVWCQCQQRPLCCCGAMAVLTTTTPTRGLQPHNLTWHCSTSEAEVLIM